MLQTDVDTIVADINQYFQIIMILACFVDMKGVSTPPIVSAVDHLPPHPPPRASACPSYIMCIMRHVVHTFMQKGLVRHGGGGGGGKWVPLKNFSCFHYA